MKKTQGQKRKGRINAIAAVVFCLVTAGGVYLYQNLMGSAYEWVDRHAEATGVVTALSSEREEYRNLKGRKRTSTYYYTDYSFEADGDLYESSAEITSSQFNDLEEGGNIEVWYDSEDPYTNALASEVAGGKQSSLSTALLAIGPFTLGFAFGLRALLMFLFGRESRKKLAEGFYTDDSWLDVDDNKLVLLSPHAMSVAKFSDKQRHELTKLYQSGADHQTLNSSLKEDDISLMLVKNIKTITSRHDNDTIEVASEEDNITLDFLNIGTKAHAKERLVGLLSDQFDVSEKKRSRLRSAMPRLVTIGVLGLIGVIASVPALWFVLGAVALYITPQLVRRLLDPSAITELVKRESLATSPQELPNELPKAA